MNTYQVPLKRKCSHCGKKYFRRNMMDIWTVRAPGQRYGWRKETVKVCMGCMDVHESRHIMKIADVKFSTVLKVKPRVKVGAST